MNLIRKFFKDFLDEPSLPCTLLRTCLYFVSWCTSVSSYILWWYGTRSPRSKVLKILLIHQLNWYVNFLQYLTILKWKSLSTWYACRVEELLPLLDNFETTVMIVSEIAQTDICGANPCLVNKYKVFQLCFWLALRMLPTAKLSGSNRAEKRWAQRSTATSAVGSSGFSSAGMCKSEKKYIRKY